MSASNEAGEPRFRIRVVAEQTGVPAATIRAWERRYGVPTPQRTNSAYRLFTEADIATVTRMRDLCDQGMAPSQAAALMKGEAAAAAQSAEPGADAAAPHEQGPWAASRARIVSAVRDFSPESLKASIREAMMLGSARSVFANVFGPALTEIGDAWHAGEISVAQEHLASEAIEGATRNLLRLVQPENPSYRAMLVCFAGERHVLPLYGAAFHFLSWGFGVTLLGDGIPPDAVAHGVLSLKPDVVGLSVTALVAADRAESLARAYAGAMGDTPWVVGGAGVGPIAPFLTAAGAIVAADDWGRTREEVLARVKPRLVR
jgi:MerR family transcriptional regulator, light-induced transcriptional regulator